MLIGAQALICLAGLLLAVLLNITDPGNGGTIVTENFLGLGLCGTGFLVALARFAFVPRSHHEGADSSPAKSSEI